MVKIERSYPAPPSLAIEKEKKHGSYRQSDVIEALKRDFNNKCYICEMGDLQDPQVEHRLPHHGGSDKEREFDWENLFWSCGHCNDVKNNHKYDSGIIDCCTIDPEEYIDHNCCGGKVTVTAHNWDLSSDEKSDDDWHRVIQNTVNLINEVFNKDNTGMRTARAEVRYRCLVKEMTLLYRTLQDYEEENNNSSAYTTLEALLDRKTPFAAFKRSYIRCHEDWYPDLQVLLE